MNNPYLRYAHLPLYLIVLASLVLLWGCAPAPAEIREGDTAFAAEAAHTPTVTAIKTPDKPRPTAIEKPDERQHQLEPAMPTKTRTSLPTDIPGPTITPRPTSEAPVTQAPPGLIYVSKNALFRTDSAGSPVKVLDLEQSEFPFLLPGGKYLITYIIEDDRATDQMRIIRIRDGHRQDLPEGFVLCFLQEIPQKPEMLVGNWNDRNNPESGDPGYQCSGVPGIYNINTQSLTLLSEGHNSVFPVSVSPDGNSLAFDQSGKPWMYTWGKEASEVDLKAYGLEEEFRVFAPAFSHSGDKIAWLYTKSDWKGEMGILILDLIQHTHTRLPGYKTISFENLNPEVQWLSDDRHLFMYYYEYEPGNENRYWLVPVDGKKAVEFDYYLSWEFSPDRQWAVVLHGSGSTRSIIAADHFLANLQKPLMEIPARRWHWSPDSRWLTLTNNYWNRVEEDFLVETGQWTLWKLDLPEDALIVGWWN